MSEPTINPALANEKMDLIKALESSYGAEAIATLEKGVDLPSGLTDLSLSASQYTCTTQKAQADGLNSGGLDSIMIGYKSEIPRWKKNSTVKWAAKTAGFPTSNHAILAARELNKAANDWNNLDIGVQFEWVTDIKEACFILEFVSGDFGNTLARAFFPNHDRLNSVQVYYGAFRPGSVNILKEIFLHELGHVLGLRHEFAASEGGAVRLGKANPQSVMSYNFPPTLQETDKEDAQAFYDYSESMYDIYKVTDYIPM